MGSYSPRPVLPTNLTVPCSCTFLSLQSGPRQREAGRAHLLAGSGRLSGVEKRDVLYPRPQIPEDRSEPTLDRGPLSLLGLSLGMVTHGQRCWGSDSGHRHPHRKEERGGRGGKRGGKEKGEEGPGDWGQGEGCTARALLQSPPLFPCGILPSCLFLQPRSPKVFSGVRLDIRFPSGISCPGRVCSP